MSAHLEFRDRKKRLNTAKYRRVMTVTVSPAAAFAKKIGMMAPCAFKAHRLLFNRQFAFSAFNALKEIKRV